MSDHDLLFCEKGADPVNQARSGAAFPDLPPPGQRTAQKPPAVSRKSNASAASKPGNVLFLLLCYIVVSGDVPYCRIKQETCSLILLGMAQALLNTPAMRQGGIGKDRVTSVIRSSAPFLLTVQMKRLPGPVQS